MGHRKRHVEAWMTTPEQEQIAAHRQRMEDDEVYRAKQMASKDWRSDEELEAMAKELRAGLEARIVERTR